MHLNKNSEFNLYQINSYIIGTTLAPPASKYLTYDATIKLEAFCPELGLVSSVTIPKQK